MPDVKQTRRQAERAARELIVARTAVIGDLAVAHAAVLAADRAIQAAKTAQSTRLEQTRRDTEAAIAAAVQTRTDACTSYGAAARSALAAGWTRQELHTLGHADAVPTAPTAPAAAAAAAEPRPRRTPTPTRRRPANRHCSDHHVADVQPHRPTHPGARGLSPTEQVRALRYTPTTSPPPTGSAPPRRSQPSRRRPRGG